MKRCLRMALTNISGDSLKMRIRCTLIMCMTVMMCEAVFDVARTMTANDAGKISDTETSAGEDGPGNVLCRITAKAAVAVSNGLSEGFVYQRRETDGTVSDCLVNENSHTLFTISPGCTGLRQVVTFACIMLTAPGRAKQKVGYILIGGIIILTVNLLRIAIIACTCHDAMEWFYPTHDIAGATSVYGTMVLLWAIHIEKWIKRGKKEKLKTR